ncbi:hypothetical protein [Pseudovibrio sp. FO-BEG1]|uniref:hypothetical protein n=1 Tax=Pseudovibrio sp. (strain FO-BEG1) TaxID=911045 RepID=UPI00031FA635|nr:hypothetical protein [Pseudovibrio sp. FO-BEG1]
MQIFKRSLITSILVVLCLISAQRVHAELIASNDRANFSYLSPLRNGLSAITLVWPIDPPTQSRATALLAGLSSVMIGGTTSRSAYEVDTFRRTKGFQHKLSIDGRDLLLTISAPPQVFPEALEYLEELLLKSEYSKGWYEREFEKFSLRNSSKTGRPSDVINEIFHFLSFGSDDVANDGSEGDIRFGQPSQVILRGGDEDVQRRVAQLLMKLPTKKWGFRLTDWASALTGAEEQSSALPSGTIHFADPDSTEMLILLVKAEEFEDEGAQIGANLLVDYIGDNSGSEMFRIIRQEMRAAYEPRSNFIVLGKNKAIISLSATVEAKKWPEIYGTMKAIYENTRAGKVDLSGLKVQHDRLNNTYVSQFFTSPVWGVKHYLHEYPDGAEGTINLPLFMVLENAPLNKIIASSEEYLPPLDDFLLILIGGGDAPSEKLKSKGYCALPKNTSLSFCLDALSQVSN